MNELKYRSPESVGMPSGAVLEFLDYIREIRYNLHSFMLLCEGDVIAEGYFSPHGAGDKHRLYSCSKSIVALAVGRLLGEGHIKLDSPLVSYFPQITDCDATLAEITVEDALRMAVPMSANPYTDFVKRSPNDVVTEEPWIECFFSGKRLTDKPHGHLFSYNSHASYMLGALTERLVGCSFIDYLRPVFDKIGVSGDVQCVRSPEGIAWGSSGVLMKPRDFAKVAQLILDKGEYEGEELLPREFMERATSKQIDTRYEPTGYPGSYGYGYQIWIEPHGFGLHGMLGQCAFCFPDKRFLFVCTSDEPDYLGKIYYGATRLWRSIGDKPLREGKDFKALKRELKALKCERSFGEPFSPTEKFIESERYNLSENPMGIDWFELSFDNCGGVLHFSRLGEEKLLRFGRALPYEGSFPERRYYGMQACTPSGRCPRALNTAFWTSPERLMIISEVVDTLLGEVSFVFEFYRDMVAMKVSSHGEGIFGEYKGIAKGVKE